MRRTRHSKRTSFAGLLLLAVFVNLYFAQLVCNLPHLAQRLLPAALAQDHHGAKHGGHSHANEHKATIAWHHQKAHEHPAPAPEKDGCCSDLVYAHFVKEAPSVDLPLLVKAPYALAGSLFQAFLRFWYSNSIRAVSHAPPDAPVPKIPDIRIFLHSLII